jgi:hypothetical protein
LEWRRYHLQLSISLYFRFPDVMFETQKRRITNTGVGDVSMHFSTQKTLLWAVLGTAKISITDAELILFPVSGGQVGCFRNGES